MYESLDQVVKELNPRILEFILQSNRITVQGFRLNGNVRETKTVMMRNTLLKTPKLEEKIMRAAKYYKQTYKLDTSWAFVSNLSEEDVKKKLNSDELHEVLFSLVDAEKLDLLFINQSNFTKEVAIKTNDEEDSTIVVKRLRNLLNDKDSEFEALKEKHFKLQQEFKEFKREHQNCTILIGNKDKAIKGLNEKKYLLEQQYSLQLEEAEKINNKVHYLESQISKRRRIVLYGAIYQKRYVEKQAQNLESLNIEYISSFDGITNIGEIDNVLILTFTMNKKEIKQLEDSQKFLQFKRIHKIGLVHSISELNDYFKEVNKIND